MSDDPKKIILARRARFIAAAIAGVGIACGKEKAPPEPCLSVAYIPPDGGDETTPMPCLTPAMPEDAAAALDASAADAGADAGADASADASADAGRTAKATGASKDAAAPRPCLDFLGPEAPTARPHPCLTPIKPKDRGSQ